jgi:membrane protein DedA with SNARE-associated domain
VRAALIVGVMALLHHQVRGPSLGYVGIGLAALASWVGVPGPGEAALVTAGTLAGRGRLDLLSLLACAWLGATLGGIGGWWIGRHAGHRLAGPRGPFAAPRRAALARGERFYARFGVLAVFLTPSWVAGIHGMRASRYLPANALAALVWAVLFGAGGDIAGPAIAEFASDLGLLGGIVLAGLVIAGTVAGLRTRRRDRRWHS